MLWRLWLLVWSDRPSKQGTMSPVELLWTAKKNKKGNKIPPRFNRGILRSFSWFIAIAIICESVNPRGYFLTNWHGDANCIQKEKKELAENNDRVLREILIEYWGKYLSSIEGNSYWVSREILIEYWEKYLQAGASFQAAVLGSAK